MSPLLTGSELIAALLTTKQPIKVINLMNGERYVEHVEPEVAIRMALSGSFEGSGRNGRVRNIRLIDKRTPNIADATHWDGRACRHYDGPVTKQTVELYDRIFRSA